MAEGAIGGITSWGTPGFKGTPFDINDPNIHIVPNSISYLLNGGQDADSNDFIWEFEVPLGHLYMMDNIRFSTNQNGTTVQTYEMRVTYGDIWYGNERPPTSDDLSHYQWNPYAYGTIDMDNLSSHSGTGSGGWVSVVTKEMPLYLYGGAKLDFESATTDEYVTVNMSWRDYFY